MVKNIKSFKNFPDLGICYQSFGKTGNTAFLSVIEEALNKRGHHIKKDKTIHTTLNNSGYQTVCRYDKPNFSGIFSNFGNNFVISIRNPYTRVLSLYLHVTKSESRGLSPSWQKKLNYNSQPLSFEKFLDLLSLVGVENIDGHTFPIASSSLIGEADYDYVIRFENFENDVKEIIRSCFDSDIDVSHKGVKTNAGEKIQKFYTAECVNIVKKLYEKDFQVLGYSQDIELATKLPDLPYSGLRIPDLYIKESSKKSYS